MMNKALFFYTTLCLFFSLDASQMSDFDESHQSFIPKELLLTTKAARQWKKIGIKNHYGVDIPLFSLHSKESLGIGEFFDLFSMIDWAKEVGFDIIQLLPINDCNNSPYSIFSAFALDPIYLSIRGLPHVEKLQAYQQLVQDFEEISAQKRVQWDLIRVKKELFLKRYFKAFFDQISQTIEYQNFLNKNLWLDGYALFKILKRTLGSDKSWEDWPDPIRTAHPTALKELIKQYSEKIDFYRFVQFLCHQQLKQVSKYAKENKILLVGDLPFIPQKDSADVWLNQKFFFTAGSLGAPPDTFSANGQDWGFPMYNWSAIQQDNYAWWMDRVKYAVQFYPIYRLDHSFGFFSMWKWKNRYLTVDQEGKSLDYRRGLFYPRDPTLWPEQGEKFFQMLLENFEEFPIAEDLGDYRPQVQEVIRNLGVCGIRVIFDTIKYIDDKWVVNLNQIPPQSLSTTSSHDSEPIRMWWVNHPEKAKELISYVGGAYHPQIEKPQLFNLLKMSFNTNSLLHVNLLQEYMNLVPNLSQLNPLEERVNIPGTISRYNWSFKFTAPIEEIVTNRLLKENIFNLMNNKSFIGVNERAFSESQPAEWYKSFEPQDKIDSTLKDGKLIEMDEVREEFALIGSEKSPQMIIKPLTLLDVMSSTIVANPFVNAASFKVDEAYGEYQQSKGPFDTVIEATSTGIVSIDMQYPPQGTRTHRTGTEWLNEISVAKKFRTGAEFTATGLLDQDINRLLPVYGYEPVSILNQTVIAFEFRQPLLKDFCLNKDAIQEAVNSLSIYKANYFYLDQLSTTLLNAVINYWDWVAGYWYLDARKKSVLRLQEAYERLTDLVKLEEVKHIDIYQVKGWLDQRKVAMVQAENFYNTALQKLKVSMGSNYPEDHCFCPPYSWETIPFPDIEVETNMILNAKSYLVQEARNGRYDILTSLVDQNIYSVLLKGAKNQYLPRLDVFVDLQLSDFEIQDRAKKYFSSALFPKSVEKDITTGIFFSVPYCRDFAKGLIKEFSASLEQSRYFTQSLQLDAERLVLETLFKIESLPNSVRYSRKSQDKYLKLLLDEEEKVNPGAIFAFIEFERRYNEAINDEINAFTELMKSIVTLHFALGQLVNCEGLFNDPMTDQVYPNGAIWRDVSKSYR